MNNEDMGKRIEHVLTALDEKYGDWAKCDTTYMQSDVNEAKKSIKQLIDQAVREAEARGAMDVWKKTYAFLNTRGDILEEWEAEVSVSPHKDSYCLVARIDELTSLQHQGSPAESFVPYREVESRIRYLLNKLGEAK